MEIVFKAKLKNVTANEGGTVIKLEPQVTFTKQVAELMTRVGMYARVTVEDEQQELPIEELEADYEQPIEGQTEIEADYDEDIFEPVVMSLPEPETEEQE